MEQQGIARAAKEALARFSVPVFLAGTDGDETPCLTLHVARPRDRRSLQQEAKAAMARAGVTVECRVRPIDHRSLDLACTLQDVMRSFAHETIVYDPTESVSRTKALVTLSHRLRSTVGRDLRGLFLEPDNRGLYVLCRRNEFLKDDALDQTKRLDVEAATKAVFSTWRAEDPASFDLSVWLCFELPSVPLVPVDAASLDKSLRRLPWMARLHTEIIVGGLATLLGTVIAGSASAQQAAGSVADQGGLELPAVSGLNGKVSLDAGEAAAHPAGEGVGSVTIPVLHSFGIQADGGLASDGGNSLWGFDGQGFWRNPNLGMVGGFISHVHEDLDIPGLHGTFLNRFGGEAEYFYGRFTPRVAAGYQNGGAKNGAFGTPELAWYPNDNLMVQGGVDLNPGTDFGMFNVEYMPALRSFPGLSIFAEGGVSGTRANYALIGFRYYFGPDKTLIRRHREDDPEALVMANPSLVVQGNMPHPVCARGGR